MESVDMLCLERDELQRRLAISEAQRLKLAQGAKNDINQLLALHSKCQGLSNKVSKQAALIQQQREQLQKWVTATRRMEREVTRATEARESERREHSRHIEQLTNEVTRRVKEVNGLKVELHRWERQNQEQSKRLQERVDTLVAQRERIHNGAQQEMDRLRAELQNERQRSQSVLDIQNAFAGGRAAGSAGYAADTQRVGGGIVERLRALLGVSLNQDGVNNNNANRAASPDVYSTSGNSQKAPRKQPWGIQLLLDAEEVCQRCTALWEGLPEREPANELFFVQGAMNACADLLQPENTEESRGHHHKYKLRHLHGRVEERRRRLLHEHAQVGRELKLQQRVATRLRDSYKNTWSLFQDLLLLLARLANTSPSHNTAAHSNNTSRPGTPSTPLSYAARTRTPLRPYATVDASRMGKSVHASVGSGPYSASSPYTQPYRLNDFTAGGRASADTDTGWHGADPVVSSTGTAVLIEEKTQQLEQAVEQVRTIMMEAESVLENFARGDGAYFHRLGLRGALSLCDLLQRLEYADQLEAVREKWASRLQELQRKYPTPLLHPSAAAAALSSGSSGMATHGRVPWSATLSSLASKLSDSANKPVVPEEQGAQPADISTDVDAVQAMMRVLRRSANSMTFSFPFSPTAGSLKPTRTTPAATADASASPPAPAAGKAGGDTGAATVPAYMQVPQSVHSPPPSRSTVLVQPPSSAGSASPPSGAGKERGRGTPVSAHRRRKSDFRRAKQLAISTGTKSDKKTTKKKKTETLTASTEEVPSSRTRPKRSGRPDWGSQQLELELKQLDSDEEDNAEAGDAGDAQHVEEEEKEKEEEKEEEEEVNSAPPPKGRHLRVTTPPLHQRAKSTSDVYKQRPAHSRGGRSGGHASAGDIQFLPSPQLLVDHSPQSSLSPSPRQPKSPRVFRNPVQPSLMPVEVIHSASPSPSPHSPPSPLSARGDSSSSSGDDSVFSGVSLPSKAYLYLNGLGGRSGSFSLQSFNGQTVAVDVQTGQVAGEVVYAHSPTPSPSLSPPSQSRRGHRRSTSLSPHHLSGHRSPRHSTSRRRSSLSPRHIISLSPRHSSSRSPRSPLTRSSPRSPRLLDVPGSPGGHMSLPSPKAMAFEAIDVDADAGSLPVTAPTTPTSLISSLEQEFVSQPVLMSPSAAVIVTSSGKKRGPSHGRRKRRPSLTYTFDQALHSLKSNHDDQGDKNDEANDSAKQEKAKGKEEDSEETKTKKQGKEKDKETAKGKEDQLPVPADDVDDDDADEQESNSTQPRPEQPKKRQSSRRGRGAQQVVVAPLNSDSTPKVELVRQPSGGSVTEELPLVFEEIDVGQDVVTGPAITAVSQQTQSYLVENAADVGMTAAPAATTRGSFVVQMQSTGATALPLLSVDGVVYAPMPQAAISAQLREFANNLRQTSPPDNRPQRSQSVMVASRVTVTPPNSSSADDASSSPLANGRIARPSAVTITPAGHRHSLPANAGSTAYSNADRSSNGAGARNKSSTKTRKKKMKKKSTKYRRRRSVTSAPASSTRVSRTKRAASVSGVSSKSSVTKPKRRVRRRASTSGLTASGAPKARRRIKSRQRSKSFSRQASPPPPRPPIVASQRTPPRKRRTRSASVFTVKQLAATRVRNVRAAYTTRQVDAASSPRTRGDRRVPVRSSASDPLLIRRKKRSTL